MSFRAGLGLAASVVLVLVMCGACGGSTSNVGGGDGGGSDGGGGGDGSGGDASCLSSVLAGNRACVPGTARANTPLALGVDATNGCLGCFTTFQPCQVDVSGTTITITMMTKTCPPPGDQACPAICALPGTTCTIPGLAAGTYTIHVSGEGTRGGLPPRELVVTADASATSCKLPGPGSTPPPLDGTKYPTSCSVDADCVVATAGDVCAPCHCPNLALAKTASPAYEADFRAALSLCPGQVGDIACAACAPSKATCVTAGSALTGTCTLQP